MFKKADIIVIIAVLLLAAVPAAVLALRPAGNTALIYIDGALSYTLPLGIDTLLEVNSQYGSNTVEVLDGRVRVLQADCPGKSCVNSGWQSSAGTVIICLPHRLEIRISGEGGYDAITG